MCQSPSIWQLCNKCKNKKALKNDTRTCKVFSWLATKTNSHKWNWKMVALLSSTLCQLLVLFFFSGFFLCIALTCIATATSFFFKYRNGNILIKFKNQIKKTFKFSLLQGVDHTYLCKYLYLPIRYLEW